MKKISLSQGKVAVIDDEDFAEINKYKWYFDNGYAIRNITVGEKRTRLSMHRFILKVKKGIEVDHKNGYGLDNRKENIRICTRSQNNINKGKYKSNISGFKGVSESQKKWKAQIQINGKKIDLGRFKTKEIAYKIYCEAAIKYHGEFSHI